MSDVQFSEMTEQELLRLIQAASAELALRAGGKPAEGIAPPAEPPAARATPPDDDRFFCLSVAKRLRGGDYISAEDRQRVASIAKQFGRWVRAQDLPTESGTGPWRKAAETYRRGFARER